MRLIAVDYLEAQPHFSDHVRYSQKGLVSFYFCLVQTEEQGPE